MAFSLQEAQQRMQVVGLGEGPSAQAVLLNPLGAVHQSSCLLYGGGGWTV